MNGQPPQPPPPPERLTDEQAMAAAAACLAMADIIKPLNYEQRTRAVKSLIFLYGL